jgi:hypothetical protein
MKRIPAPIRHSTLAAGFPSLVAMTMAFAAPPVYADDVRPADLAQLIDKADKLVVLESPRKDAKVLFESAARSDLDALKGQQLYHDPDATLEGD